MSTRRVLTSLIFGIGLTLTSVIQAADPSLIGWWKFDEGAGTTAKDSSVNGNDATLSGGTAWVPGVGGTALQFNGSDSLVSTGKSLLNNLTTITLAGWVSAERVGVYSSLFGQNEIIEFGFTSESGGQVGTWMLGNGWQFVGADYAFSYPSWHHLALTGDATGVVIYIDGQEEARGTNGMTTSGSSSFLFSIGGNVFNASGDWFLGEIDDVRVYNRALAAQEIPVIMQGTSPELAANPKPADKATDVPRDEVLTWTPGLFAKTHDVYFGTVFDDVNTASLATPKDVLASQGQDTISYDPAGLLTFGQTYFWRVDEINAPPDSARFKGAVWSFTSEPMGYPIKPINATASSKSNNAVGPEKTIDGSGLNALDQHSTSSSQMWLSKKNVTPIWIQYEFDSPYRLYQMWVWNQNQSSELDYGFGAMEVSIEVSTDGSTWTALEGVPEFAQGTGEDTYVHNTTVDFHGVLAKFVKLNILSNWGGLKQAGLSEVRFFYLPVKAYGPTPVSEATGVALDGVLNWRPGREAVGHDLYFGTDPSALSKVGTVTQHSYSLGSLGIEYGKKYYWKVNEVNDAATPTSWEGAVWSFTTVGYAVVDDMESYDDLCNRIFLSWGDQYGYNATPECGGGSVAGNNSGSTVGNAQPPYAERTIVHSGRQSLPMTFDNTKSPYYSETQREWTTPQAWTGGGANTLRIYLNGVAAGFVESSPGTYLMNGTGTDIWGVSDQFRFVYKSLKGNGSMVARVDAVANTNVWAKAGVMIRETLGAGSTHQSCVVTPGSGVSFQHRDAADATSLSATQAGLVAPYWVKITRSGNTFTAQCSADGVTWTSVGTNAASSSATVTMASDVYIGLAVTSHAADVVCGAKFSNVSSTGGVSGSWQIAEIGAAQAPGNAPETCYVAVQDSNGKVKVISNPDTVAIATGNWEEWNIPLSQFTSAGVNLNSVKKMIIGAGDRISPKAGSAGKLYIDDIRLTRVSTP